MEVWGGAFPLCFPFALFSSLSSSPLTKVDPFPSWPGVSMYFHHPARLLEASTQQGQEHPVKPFLFWDLFW